MAGAKNGDSVKVHYTGKLKDGTVFDSSRGREPIEFTIGERSVIPGFEDAVIGMKTGETKTIHIAAENAYGARREDMVFEVTREEFPAHITPEVNQQFRVLQDDGRSVIVTIMEVTDEHVVLDANHPLAGEELIFDIELTEIV
jgi:FKBP-type peptidyl-prolyl cis-trans isomerase 2